MAGTTVATFACPQCGDRYIWRVPLAGKKVACDCGREFLAPRDRPVPPEAANAGASPNSIPPHLAAMYPSSRRGAEQTSLAEEGDRGWFQCYFVPPILILLGLAIDATQVAWKKPELPSRLTVYPLEMAMLVGLAVFTIVLALIMAAMFFNVNFGRNSVAAFKAAAITIFGTSVAVTLARLDTGVGSISGLAIGWSSMIMIYWACFAALFKLEFHETIMTLFMVAVGQAAVLWAVLG